MPIWERGRKDLKSGLKKERGGRGDGFEGEALVFGLRSVSIC